MATQSRAERSLLTSLCNVSLFTLIHWHLLWYSTSSLALFWHVFVSRWCGLCKVARASTNNIIEEHTHFNRSVLCLYLNLSWIVCRLLSFSLSFVLPTVSWFAAVAAEHELSAVSLYSNDNTVWAPAAGQRNDLQLSTRTNSQVMSE